jgi:hypothetical protein
MDLYMHYNKLHTCLLFIFLICNVSLHGAVSSVANKDDFRTIRYQDAFDQDDLWRGEFRGLMEHLGCDGNLFGEASTSEQEQSTDNEYIALTIEDDADHDVQAYEEACMRRLNNVRRRTLAEPGMFALAEVGLMFAGGAVAYNTLGGASMGGSFAIFAALFNSLAKMPGVILSGYNLMSWPDNPLAPYEERFARNKCFIPNQMWPKILRAFISARTNEFERQNHTYFLDFALGITTHKPQPPLRLKENFSLEMVKLELDSRIQHHFEDYTPESRNARELCLINLNVQKFVDQLMRREGSPSPRYLHFDGQGGIGKTHFVNCLSQWLQELLPESVNYESLVINSAAELEGTPDRPGALLKVLHNQLARNKRGSVVMIDEASWLNEAPMCAPAKRTFNLDQSKLCTAYFGNGPDGAGISLTIPPMLVVVASNDEISDVNLASRFDIVHYPLPSKVALVNHAARIIGASKALKQAHRDVKNTQVASWVETLDKDQLNFRYVEGNVEATFLVAAHDAAMQAASSGSQTKE